MAEPMEGVEYSHEIEPKPKGRKSDKRKSLYKPKERRGGRRIESLQSAQRHREENARIRRITDRILSQTLYQSNYFQIIGLKFILKEQDAYVLERIINFTKSSEPGLITPVWYRFENPEEICVENFSLEELRIDELTNEFIILPLRMQVGDSVHANVAIINRKNQKIEIFEPHGKWNDKFAEIGDSIKMFLTQLIVCSSSLTGYKICTPECTMNQVLYAEQVLADYDYMESAPETEIRPEGPQWAIINDKKHAGTCIVWTIYMAYMRVLNHVWEAHIVSTQIMNILQTAKSFNLVKETIRMIVERAPEYDFLEVDLKFGDKCNLGKKTFYESLPPPINPPLDLFEKHTRGEAVDYGVVGDLKIHVAEISGKDLELPKYAVLKESIFRWLKECFPSSYSNTNKKEYIWSAMWIGYELAGILLADRGGVIWNVCTVPNFRRRGVAKRLISIATQRIIFFTGRRPTLFVDNTLPTKNELLLYYTKIGFSIITDPHEIELMKRSHSELAQGKVTAMKYYLP